MNYEQMALEAIKIAEGDTPPATLAAVTNLSIAFSLLGILHELKVLTAKP